MCPHLGINAAASQRRDAPSDGVRVARGDATGLLARPARWADLSGRIGELCGCGLSRHDVAERLGISERTVYRHLAQQHSRSQASAGGEDEGAS